MSSPNEEGYVVSYPRLNQDDLKVKIKMADYVRLHRIITGMNAHTLWETFKAPGYPGLDSLKDTPDHIKKWARAWYQKLHQEHLDIYVEVCNMVFSAPFREDFEDSGAYKKACAEHFFRMVSYMPERIKLKSAYFIMLDRGNIAAIESIWDLLEPRGDDRSFQPLDTEEISA